AGRYLVTLENDLTDPRQATGSDGDTGADLVRLPEGTTVDDVRKDQATATAVPARVYAATWAGGPFAPFKGTGHTVVDLTPGQWPVLPNGLGRTQPAQPLTVTVPAASGTPTEPTASVTVSLQEYAFTGLDRPVAAGPQIWKVTNAGSQPHELIL